MSEVIAIDNPFQIQDLLLARAYQLPKGWAERWSGLFWSVDSNASFLLSFTPEEFSGVITFFAEIDAIPSGENEIAFLFAGGAIDLALNEYKERAEALVSFGKGKFPSYDWETIEQNVRFLSRPGQFTESAIRNIYSSTRRIFNVTY